MNLNHHADQQQASANHDRITRRWARRIQKLGALTTIGRTPAAIFGAPANAVAALREKRLKRRDRKLGFLSGNFSASSRAPGHTNNRSEQHPTQVRHRSAPLSFATIVLRHTPSRKHAWCSSYSRANDRMIATLRANMRQRLQPSVITPLTRRHATCSPCMGSLDSRVLPRLGLLAISMLLMLRVVWLDRAFGGLGHVYQVHHVFGTAAFVLLLVHPLAMSSEALLVRPAAALDLLWPTRRPVSSSLAGLRCSRSWSSSWSRWFHACHFVSGDVFIVRRGWLMPQWSGTWPLRGVARLQPGSASRSYLQVCLATCAECLPKTGRVEGCTTASRKCTAHPCLLERSRRPRTASLRRCVEAARHLSRGRAGRLSSTAAWRSPTISARLAQTLR